MIYWILFILAVLVGVYWYRISHRTFKRKDLEELIGKLDHDISIPNARLIESEAKTGFDVEVGPTGWPVGVNQMWEISLFEDDDYYYARLAYHEYMLWWSFDDPYIVCKIPKCNLSGDMKGDYKYRYKVLWDITYTTYRSYDYKPYMPDAKVEAINGHTVQIGDTKFGYSKYLIISDVNHAW